MIISERIFYLLKQKSMTQSEFGKKAGIASSTISDWKRKKTNPLSEYIMPICEVLEVSPEQLLTGKGIDTDYEGEQGRPSTPEYVFTKSDIRLLEEVRGLQGEQQKRLMTYLETLKKLEELETENR